MSDKVQAYGSNNTNVDELKFAYNPGKFIHVLFMMYPAVH
jgi:hypothetical protein